MAQNARRGGLHRRFAEGKIRIFFVLIGHIAALQQAVQAAAGNARAEMAPVVARQAARPGVGAGGGQIRALGQKLRAHLAQQRKAYGSARLQNHQHLPGRGPKLVHGRGALRGRKFVQHIACQHQIGPGGQRIAHGIARQPSRAGQGRSPRLHQLLPQGAHGLFALKAGDAA